MNDYIARKGKYPQIAFGNEGDFVGIGQCPRCSQTDKQRSLTRLRWPTSDQRTPLAYGYGGMQFIKGVETAHKSLGQLPLDPLEKFV